MGEKEYVELENDFIVLAVPSATVEVEITAKVWNGEEVIKVSRVMPFEEVREAFAEAHDGYIPSDALFFLNPDIDKSKLERLLSKYLDEEE
ncbi:MAG: hypothetical protein IJ640_06620 [Prevotella sp.]|nr:hypothetical protein [Prevotella sp.]